MRNEKKYLIINSKYFGEDYLKTKIDEELESKRLSLYDDEKIDMQKEIIDAKDSLEEIYENLMHMQYMDASVENVFKKYGEEGVVKSLKRIEEHLYKYQDVRIRIVVSEDEIEEFLEYIKDYELRPTIEPLNAKTFLKLCRICYDAAPIKVYPEGISDYFIYKNERGSAFHEDSTVLDPECYENDENLKEKYTIKEFLKLCRVCFDAAPVNIYIDEVSDYYIYAKENDFKISDDYRVLNAITDPEKIGVIKEPDVLNNVKEFSEVKYYDYTNAFQIKGSSFNLIKQKGAYKFEINKWYLPDLTRGILMYIKLREKGYNLTVDAVEVLKKYERYSLES